MSAFMIGREQFFLLGHHQSAALGAHHDLVLGIFKFRHCDNALATTSRHQSRFIDQIHQISARKPRCAARHNFQINIWRKRNFANMDFENFLAAHHIGIGNNNLAIKTARTQQGWIEHVRAVGGRNQDNPLIGLKAVHFNEQLIECLFALIIATAKARATMTTHSIDFVDKDNAGRILLGLFKHVAHAARANAHEHFNKVRTRNGEEGHIGFACNGARQQGLTCAGGADKQDAAWNTPTQTLELLRIAQKFYDLLQIILGFINASDIFKGHAAMRLGEHFGFRFAKAHGFAARPLHLPGQENPHSKEGDQRQAIDQQSSEPRIPLRGRPGCDRDILLVKILDQRGIIGGIGREGPTICIIARHLMAGDRDIAHTALVDIHQQLAKGNFRCLGSLSGILEQHHQSDNQQENDHPEGKIPNIGIHCGP